MNRRLRLAMVIACATSTPAYAMNFPAPTRVSDARLDATRGGFDLGDDLRASFALERMVRVNGVEAIRTSVRIPDVARMSIDQARALSDALRTTVVTNGAGGVGTAAPAIESPVTVPPVVTTATLPLSGGPGLIVQNALDNQTITATTTIDASVNTSRMLQNLRLDESIKDAVITFRGN